MGKYYSATQHPWGNSVRFSRVCATRLSELYLSNIVGETSEYLSISFNDNNLFCFLTFSSEAWVNKVNTE